MIEKILIFYIVIFTGYFYLSIFWGSKFSRIAFTWFGPVPCEYEYLSQFKLSKFKYALGWLLQFIYAISIASLLSIYFPWLKNETYFMVVLFALPIGLGIALLATIGFLITFLKTTVFGPNQYFEVKVEEDFEDET